MHIWQYVRNRGGRCAKYLFFFTGAASLLWMCIRIIPKPSRAEYPCMKAAAPIAGGFIAYIAGAAAALFSLKKARRYFQSSKYLLGSILLVAGLSAGVLAVIVTDTETYAVEPEADSLFVPTDPPNTPMGVARGIYPGRVVWMWDTSATSWSGSGYWWEDTYTRQDVVDSMFSRSIRTLTGKTSDTEAWDALFKYFNIEHGKGNVGYLPGEKVIVKINLNESAGPGTIGNASFTSPHTVLALVRQLVQKAGVPDSNITFYDLVRYVPDPIFNKCRSVFPKVHFMGWQQVAGREQYKRDTTNRIRWSQDLTLEINGGNPAYMATAVTQAAYMINLGSFRPHRYMGVTFCAKNHFGSVSTNYRGSPDQWAPHGAGLHAYAAVHDFPVAGSPEWSFVKRPMGTYNVLVDLMGFKDLGGKTLLFMIDALYYSKNEGQPVSNTLKLLSSPFNNDWPSSLFISQDNIAIESVGLDFLRTEQAVNPQITEVYGAVDNYLHEGALADNPPSGTFYDPERDGTRLRSLGVHEHWNNAAEKKYSRNLGTGNGIELIQLNPSVTSITEKHVPSGFALYSNYPNPFNPSTTIRYRIPVRSRVIIDVVDIQGRLVSTLVDGELPAGLHMSEFDAKTLSSGIYFYRLRARPLPYGSSAPFNETKKLVILK